MEDISNLLVDRHFLRGGEETDTCLVSGVVWLHLCCPESLWLSADKYTVGLFVEYLLHQGSQTLYN
jgi:hypothetical protein